MNKKLIHITDVGASQGNGTDSSYRIRNQYSNLGFESEIISAGFSPLNIAFTACSKLSPRAILNTKKINSITGLTPLIDNTIAVNSAPRNSNTNKPDGEEKHIYRLKTENTTFIGYGLEVFKYIYLFEGISKDYLLEKIISINNIIEDTSKGSQFRSAEHLPIAHCLESLAILDQNSKVEKFLVDEHIDLTNRTIILPPDEYMNCRCLFYKKDFLNIVNSIDLLDTTFIKRESLTSVVPGELSIWPSSNHFNNEELIVANIGTRWKEGTTKTSDEKVILLANKLNNLVGNILNYSI